jgi:hypothetical protein
LAKSTSASRSFGMIRTARNRSPGIELLLDEKRSDPGLLDRRPEKRSFAG